MTTAVAAAAVIRIPRRFFDDHADRALPTPTVHRATRAHVWIDRTDPALAELVNDAAFYADRNGPDQCPPGVIPGARALLKALGFAGVFLGFVAHDDAVATAQALTNHDRRKRIVCQSLRTDGGDGLFYICPYVVADALFYNVAINPRRPNPQPVTVITPRAG
jgi:hypothetical protein